MHVFQGLEASTAGGNRGPERKAQDVTDGFDKSNRSHSSEHVWSLSKPSFLGTLPPPQVWGSGFSLFGTKSKISVVRAQLEVRGPPKGPAAQHGV